MNYFLVIFVTTCLNITYYIHGKFKQAVNINNEKL
jgi:hypothetical protein